MINENWPREKSLGDELWSKAIINTFKRNKPELVPGRYTDTSQNSCTKNFITELPIPETKFNP